MLSRIETINICLSKCYQLSYPLHVEPKVCIIHGNWVKRLLTSRQILESIVWDFSKKIGEIFFAHFERIARRIQTVSIAR